MYWCGYDREKGRSVQYGIINEIYRRDSDNGIERAVVDYLTVKSYRKINGTPINEFEPETCYKKLPKGYTDTSDLYEDIDDIPEDVAERIRNLDLTSPQDILSAYNEGILVKKKDEFNGKIGCEITKTEYRIIKYYERWEQQQPTEITLYAHQMCLTYAEAKAEVDAYHAELKRQSELSDEEWAIEQIDNELAKWKSIHSVADDRFEYVRNQILSLGAIDEVEIKVLAGVIYWTRWRRDAKGELHIGKWRKIDVE